MGMVREGKGRRERKRVRGLGKKRESSTCIFEHFYSANKHLNEAI